MTVQIGVRRKLILYYSIAFFVIFRDCTAEFLHSKLGLSLQPARSTGNEQFEPEATTETFGIVIKLNSNNSARTREDRWTRVELSPPIKSEYSTVLWTGAETSAVASAIDQVTEVPDFVPLNSGSTENSLSNVSAVVAGKSKTVPKKTRQQDDYDLTYGLLDDDDDDDDDEDNEDEDDEGDEEYEVEYEEYENEEDGGNGGEESDHANNDALEQTESEDKTVEEYGEVVEGVGEAEYEHEPEEHHQTIVLNTKKKHKKKKKKIKKKHKKGKKHGKIKFKDVKKLKKFMLPLLIAYKMKFMAMVPLLLGGLMMIVISTGFAGFFFALFAVGLGMKHR